MINKLKTLLFILEMYFAFLLVWILRLLLPFLQSKKNKDVLYLEAFTRDGAGYNYRVRYWKEELEKAGYKVDSAFIFEYADEFFQYANQPSLQRFLIKSIYKRIKQILSARHYKLVIVRRNLIPYNQYGNHFLEKLLVVVNSNCVLDFDDDIGAQESVRRSKFDRLLIASDQQFYGSFHYFKAFIVGSKYLSDLVKIYKPNAELMIVPTCVNYTLFEPKIYTDTPINTITFGWIGGNQNLFLLKQIIPDLNRIASQFSIRLLVIAGVDNYNFEAEFPIEFVLFSLETEKDYLRKMDIGLMPLQDDAISRGKCGFKLLQYMGLAVPGIASAITINKEIIQDGENGWLVENNSNWYEIIIRAISQRNNWGKIGANAFNTVDEHYSFNANASKYIQFTKKHLKNGN